MSRHRRTSLERIADRQVIHTAIAICVGAGIIPFLFGIALSFCSVDFRGRLTFGSIDGYRSLLAGGHMIEFTKIVLRSITVTVLSMALAVPTAYWVTGFKQRIQGMLLTFVVAPWVVCDMLRAFGWQLLLSPDGSPAKACQFLFHLGHVPDLRYTFAAVLLGLISSMIPAGVLSVFAALPPRNGNEWLAAAEIGRPYDVFRLFALGRAKAGIVLGAMIVFVLSCFSSAEPLFLDGPTQTSVGTIAASLANIGVPALLAFGSFLIGFLLLTGGTGWIVYRAMSRSKRRQKSARVQATPAPLTFPNRWRRGVSRGFRPILDYSVRVIPTVAGVISIILCFSPLLAVAVEAFRQPSPSGMHWTLQNFRFLLSANDMLDAFRNSAEVAMVVAVGAALLGFVLSLVVWAPGLQKAVGLLAVSLVLLPGEVYAISLLQTLRLFGQDEGGWLLVVLAHLLWTVPFATGTLSLANQHLGEHTLESAFEMGNRPIGVIFRFIARINLGKLAGVAFLAAMLSLNEYIRSSYLGASLVTVTNQIHGRLTSGLLPQNRSIFAAELLILILSLLTGSGILTIVGSSRISQNPS